MKKLAKAISQTESGGKCSMKGESGEYGCFQFMPTTWKQVSHEVLGTVVTQSPINEEYVAVKKIEKLLEKHDEKETALIWNGSLGGTEKPIIKSGVNSKGVKYDTHAYSLKVMKAYATFN